MLYFFLSHYMSEKIVHVNGVLPKSRRVPLDLSSGVGA